MTRLLSFRLPALLLAGLLVPANFLAAQTQIQVLSVADGDAPPGLAEELAEGAAGMSFSVGGPGSFSFGSSLGGVDPNNRSQLFSLLTNESVRNELKLSEEQYDGAKKIMAESRNRMSELIRNQMKNSSGGRSVRIGGSEFSKLMEENRAQAETAIEEILLPTQLERVRQLAYQIEVSQDGMGEALTAGRLGQEIGVHEDQKQNLVDRAAKIEAEAQAAIIAIRAKAREKLFKELTPEQRKSAEKLLGPYFQYEEPSMGQQLRKSMKSFRANRDSKNTKSKK